MATRSDAYIQGLLGQIQNNNAMAIGRGDFATAPISVDRVAAEMSAMGYAIPDQTKFNPTRRNPINRNAVDTSASWSRAAAQMPTMDMSAPAYSDDFLASVTADYNNWLSSQGQEPEQPMGMSIQRVGDIPNGMNADMGNRTIERIGDIPTDNVENRSIQRIGDIPVLEDDATRYQKMYDARNAAGPNMVGNVDINHRPILLNDDGSYSTSQTQYQQKWYGDEENGGYRIAHYTPILADGQRMTDEQMQQYLDNVMAMPDPMEADRNALGLLYQVDTDFNGEKITDANLQNAFQYADLWDQNMHTIQDGLYGEEAALLRQLQTPQSNAVSPQNAVQSISGGNTQPSGGRSVAAPQTPSSEDEIPSLTREEKNRTEKFRPNWKEINAEADRVVKRMKQRNPKISKAELNAAKQRARDSAYRKQQIKFENSIKPAQNPMGELSPFENVPVQNLPAKNRDEAKARMDNTDEIPTTLTDAFSQGRTPKIQNTKGPMSPFGTRHDIAPADASRDAKYRDAFKARSENAEVIPEEVSRDAKYREAFKARQETPVPFEPVGNVATNTGVTSDIVKPGLRGQNLNQNNMVPMEREAQYDVNLPEDEILPIELTDAPAERNTVNSPRADLSGIQFEEGRRDRGDANSHISNVRTVERYLDPNYQMSREEQDDAQEIAHQWFTAHPPREWLTPNAPEELRREAGDMIQLAAKTSNYGAYAAGLMDQLTKLPSYLNRSILYTLGSIGMSPEEKAAYRQEINDAFQGLNQQFQGMRTQSPVAYGGGLMAGRTMQSMAVDSAADALGVTGRLSGLTDRLANTRAGQAVARLAQNVAGRFGRELTNDAATQVASDIANSAMANFGEDLINDTLPSAVRNYESGMTARENALASLQNIGENALIDIGLAGAQQFGPYIPSLLHRTDEVTDAARSADLLRSPTTIDGSTDIPRLDNAADAARSADTVTDAARTADTATDAARTADTITDAARAADVPRTENPFEDAPRNAFDDVPRPEAPEHWFEEPRAEQPRVEEPRPTAQEVRDSRNANPEAEPWERSVLNANSRLDNAQVVNERLSRMSHNIDQAVAASGNPRAEQALDDFYNAAIERRAGGGVDFEDAAERLKQVLNQMGLDTKDVDEVQKSLRAYESLSPLFDAQKASQHPEVYDEMIGYLKQFEDKLDQYQDGTVSFDELQQAMRDAQNAVGRMDTAVKNAALGDVKAIKQQYKDELYAIREEFGIHSQKQNVVVGISKETADALKYEKQSPEQAIEAINGMMNRDKNKSFVTLAIQPDKADVFLGTDDVRSLIDRVTANRDARWQALHPEPQFPNLQKSIYYEFAETAQEELNQLRNAEKVWTDQDEEDLLNLFTPEEREAYLANKTAQAEAPRPVAMEEEPIPTLTGEVPEEPAIETPRAGTAAMDTEEIPTLTGEVPEVPREAPREAPRPSREQSIEEVNAESGLPFVEPERTDVPREDIPRLGESDVSVEPEPTPEPTPEPNTGFGGRKISDADAVENDNARKLSKNFDTIQKSQTWSDAQKQEVSNWKEKWEYDPDVEKNLAANAEEAVNNDITGVYDYYRNNMDGKKMDSQDVHNALSAAKHYDQMALEAAQNGDMALAQSYRMKALDMQDAARRSGTEAAQYLAAMKYYARTGEGSVMAAEKAMMETADKWVEQHPKAADGIDELAQKLSNYLRTHNAEAIMNGTDESLKDALRVDINEAVDRFLNGADKQTRKALKGLSQEAIEQMLLDQRWEDIATQLDFFASSGGMGIKLDTMKKVDDLFAEAEKYGFDSRDYVKLEEEAYTLLANDLAPKGSSFKDKFDQWRYFAMLANPTTHIKNVTGNTLFGTGMVSVKNTLAATIEAAADRVSKATGGGGITRTKSILTGKDADLVRAAKRDGFNNFYRELTGGNKYTNVGHSIDQAIPTWSTQNKAGRIMNWLSEANTKALNVEDELFMFQKYSTSLAGYMKANGLGADALSSTDDAVRQIVEEGRNYALRQAEEAAFHQNSNIANNLSTFTKNLRNSDSAAARALGTVMDVTVPFKKTPVNIVRSIYEYSPAALYNVVKDIGPLRRGAAGAANKLIDDVSKVATGSAAMLLGAVLAREGIIKVNVNQGREAAGFDTMTGRQNLSVKVGNKYINVSEFAPAATPFVLGATVYNTWANREDGDAALNTMLNGLSAISDSVTDMTMLSGIADVFKDVKNADSDSNIWANLGIGVTGNLASQMLPTIGRKLETTIDDTKRSTYSDRSGLAKKVDQEARYLTTKIPGLQDLGERMSKSDNEKIKQIGDYIGLPAAVDAWGRVKENSGGSFAGRAVNNFLSPTTVTEDTSDQYDEEIRRIFDATGEKGVFPYTAQSEGKLDGYTMNPHEFEEYSIAKGQMSHDLVQTFLDDENYTGMSDEDRAEMLDTLYRFSKAYNQAPYGGKVSSTNAKLSELYDEGGSQAVIDYLIMKYDLESAGLSLTDKTQSLYEEGGIPSIADYAEAKTAVNDAGLNMSDKAEEIYREQGEGVLQSYADAKIAANNVGLPLNDTTQRIYNESGAQGLAAYAAQRNEANALGLSYNQTVRDLYQTGGTEGVQAYAEAKKAINEAGLDVSDKTQQIYADYGSEGLKEYADISRLMHGNTINDVLQYLNRHPDQAETVLKYYGNNWNGTLSQQDGEWVYVKPNGKVQTYSEEIPVLQNNTAWREDITSVPSDYLDAYVKDDILGTVTYGRYRDYAPDGDLNDFLGMKYEMDNAGNRNGSLSTAEITGYIDNLNLTQEEKAALFSVYANSNWKNPYM